MNTLSNKVDLKSSLESIEQFNNFVERINTRIGIHNEKVKNKEKTLSQLKEDFWAIMRWDYDTQISNFSDEQRSAQKKISKFIGQSAEIERKIDKQNEIIKIEQKNTVNIDEAIEKINNNLQEIGMSDFSIKKYDERFYRLVEYVRLSV